MVGFTVEGLAADGEPLRRLDGLRPGQRLVLTKPLGTGVLFHADMQGRLRGPWFQAALASMQRPNAAAAEVAAACGASGATDVTGFGLAGHLGAMTRASGVAAELVLEALPALPGALELLAAADPRLELLFDPQTSGGLLFGVAPERAAEALARLREAGDARAAVVGETAPASDGRAALGVRTRW